MQKDQKKFESQKGQLFITALPIGNSSDICARAIETLQFCDVIAAEDTRNFQLFASLVSLKYKKVISYHDHTEREIAPRLIQSLLAGENIAIVSDAGTPLINDPGHHIIKLAFENKIRVIPIPGPSSITAALSVCPIGGSTFSFIGFAPNNSKDLTETLFKFISISDRTVVFEAPHRLTDHLETTKNLYKNTKIFVAREISKNYEEFLYDTPQNLLLQLTDPKGEFVIIYPKVEQPSLSHEDLQNQIQKLVDSGLKAKQILEVISEKTNLSRRDLYDLITKIKHNL